MSTRARAAAQSRGAVMHCLPIHCSLRPDHGHTPSSPIPRSLFPLTHRGGEQETRGGPSDGEHSHGGSSAVTGGSDALRHHGLLLPGSTTLSSPVPRSLFPPPYVRACCPHPYAWSQTIPRVINSQTAAGTSETPKCTQAIEPRACCPDAPGKSPNYLS